MEKGDGLWVIVEHNKGEISKVSLELISKARELADRMGESVTALILGGEDEFKEIIGEKPNCDENEKLINRPQGCWVGRVIGYGADKVVVVKGIALADYTTEGYVGEIYRLALDRKPEVILIGATYLGRDLAPRLAARLKTGLTADCTGLDIDETTKNLLMTRPAFGGNIMATIECPNSRPQMSTVRPGVFPLCSPNPNRKGTIEILDSTIPKDEIRIAIEKIVREKKKIKDIGEAEIIVSGGRGLLGAEGFKILKELADILGGTVGASRAAVDSGWIDKACQVGQTGKTVRPKLYIACGISGAIQHLAGMSESDYIIAINKDESAPIMSAADLAICGDLFKIVPKLTEEMKKYKNGETNSMFCMS